MINTLECVDGPKDGQLITVPDEMMELVRRKGMHGGYTDDGREQPGWYHYDPVTDKLKWRWDPSNMS